MSNKHVCFRFQITTRTTYVPFLVHTLSHCWTLYDYKLAMIRTIYLDVRLIDAWNGSRLSTSNPEYRYLFDIPPTSIDDKTVIILLRYCILFGDPYIFVHRQRSVLVFSYLSHTHVHFGWVVAFSLALHGRIFGGHYSWGQIYCILFNSHHGQVQGFVDRT